MTPLNTIEQEQEDEKYMFVSTLKKPIREANLVGLNVWFFSMVLGCVLAGIILCEFFPSFDRDAFTRLKRENQKTQRNQPARAVRTLRTVRPIARRKAA